MNYKKNIIKLVMLESFSSYVKIFKILLTISIIYNKKRLIELTNPNVKFESTF